MRRLLAAVLVVGGFVVFTGCATRGSVRELNARLDQLVSDVTELLRQQEAATRETAPLTVDVRTMSGRLREAETQLRDVTERLAVLTHRVNAAESSLRETVAVVEALPRASLGSPPGDGRARPRASSNSEAERAFAAALATYRAGEHGQAVLDLTEFIARHRDHPLAGRAQLWIGDAYFRQRDYRQALVEYRKAIDRPTDPAVAADAWVKIGETHQALRQRPSAVTAWQRAVREYPESDGAARARALLRK